MSYDIDLRDQTTNNIIIVKDKVQEFGGTFAVGGTTDLSFNITYNYARTLRDILGPKGIRTIYGLTALESIPIIEAAIMLLSNDGDDCDDYWTETDWNVKQALKSLLTIGAMAPHGVWHGD